MLIVSHDVKLRFGRKEEFLNEIFTLHIESYVLTRQGKD
jgi:hypothetical protein